MAPVSSPTGVNDTAALAFWALFYFEVKQMYVCTYTNLIFCYHFYDARNYNMMSQA